MIELEIDDKKVSVDEGTSIIEAADSVGIYIPRFCYHKKLSIAANCRMCIVEVDKVGKPMPACATPVTSGMKVMTKSKKTLEAQRMVMEFLLINHPLDCPICDQGGECELQDLAMGFGRAYSNYDESKRAVFSEDIGPLIETEMTRCIQCTRCVRFGEEIAGLRELGVLNRGEQEEISTYVKHFMQSELSGNIIDICPVGALTDKPGRYRGRSWEYREHPGISPHDCAGASIFVHTRGQEYSPSRRVMRAVPRENEAINETWMSDRDRFSHFGLYHESRLYQPKIKREGQWQTVEWPQALAEVVSRTRDTINTHGAAQLGALTSANATIEELYLLQKLLRGLGVTHIDHRTHTQDFSDQQLMPSFPNLGIPIREIDKQQMILLIGSDVRFEQPIISHRINQAHLEGTKVLAINPMDYSFIFGVDHKIIVSPNEFTQALQRVDAALSSDAKNTNEFTVMADFLKSSQKKAIFLGAYALNHPDAALIRAFAKSIAEKTGASLGMLTEGANSAGAWLAGAIPHRGAAGATLEKTGFDARTMLTTNPLKQYFLFNLEPEFDCTYSAAALKTLSQADCVVAFTTFTTPAMENYADILLPIAPFTETSGTYVNVEGQWQSFPATGVAHEESKPAWKILRLLGNQFDLPGFDYQTSEAVHHEIKQAVDAMQPLPMGTLPIPTTLPNKTGLFRLAPWPIYRTDALVRRSKPLQETMVDSGIVFTNQRTANRHQLIGSQQVRVKQNDSEAIFTFAIDDRLADDAVLLPSGITETAGFGQAEALISLERVGS